MAIKSSTNPGMTCKEFEMNLLLLGFIEAHINPRSNNYRLFSKGENVLQIFTDLSDSIKHIRGSLFETPTSLPQDFLTYQDCIDGLTYGVEYAKRQKNSG